MQAAGQQSITEEDVVSLIEEASREASNVQGRALKTEEGVSQVARLNLIDGRGEPDEALGAQKFHEVVKKLLDDFASKPVEACTVRSLGDLVSDALEQIELSSCCRPRSTAGSKDLFPIPVLKQSELRYLQDAFLRAIVMGLSSLAGTTAKTVEKPSPAAARVLKRLRQVVKSSPLLEAPSTGICFQCFFDTRGLDYSGDEVRLAQEVCWRNIEPSLPPSWTVGYQKLLYWFTCRDSHR